MEGRVKENAGASYAESTSYENALKAGKAAAEHVPALPSRTAEVAHPAGAAAQPTDRAAGQTDVRQQAETSETAVDRVLARVHEQAQAKMRGQLNLLHIGAQLADRDLESWKPAAEREHPRGTAAEEATRTIEGWIAEDPKKYAGADGMRLLSERAAQESQAAKNSQNLYKADAFKAAAGVIDDIGKTIPAQEQAIPKGRAAVTARDAAESAIDTTREKTTERAAAEAVNTFIKESMPDGKLPEGKWGLETLARMCEMQRAKEQSWANGAAVPNGDFANEKRALANAYADVKQRLEKAAEAMPASQSSPPPDSPVATELEKRTAELAEGKGARGRSAIAQVVDQIRKAEQDPHFDRSPEAYKLLIKQIETQSGYNLRLVPETTYAESEAYDSARTAGAQIIQRISEQTAPPPSGADRPASGAVDDRRPADRRESDSRAGGSDAPAPTPRADSAKATTDGITGPYAENIRSMSALVSQDLIASVEGQQYAIDPHTQPARHRAAEVVSSRVAELAQKSEFTGPDGLRRLSEQLRADAATAPVLEAGEYAVAMKKVDAAAKVLENTERLYKAGDGTGAIKQFLEYQVERQPEGSEERGYAERVRDYVNEQLDRPDFPKNRWGFNTLARICATRDSKEYAEEGELGLARAYENVADELRRLSNALPKSTAEPPTDTPVSDQVQGQRREPAGHGDRERAGGIQESIKTIRQAEKTADFDRTPGSYRLLSELITNQADYVRAGDFGRLDEGAGMFEVARDVQAHAQAHGTDTYRWKPPTTAAAPAADSPAEPAAPMRSAGGENPADTGGGEAKPDSTTGSTELRMADAGRNATTGMHAESINELRSRVMKDLVDSLWLHRDSFDPRRQSDQWDAATTVASRVGELSKQPEYAGPEGLKKLKEVLRDEARAAQFLESNEFAIAMDKLDAASSTLQKSEATLKAGDVHAAMKEYLDYKVAHAEEWTDAHKHAETVREFLKEQLDRPDFPKNRWGYEALAKLCDLKAAGENRSDMGNWDLAEAYTAARDQLQRLAGEMPKPQGQQQPADAPLATKMKEEEAAKHGDLEESTPGLDRVLEIIENAEKDPGFDRSSGSYHLLSQTIKAEADAEMASELGDLHLSFGMSDLASNVQTYAETAPKTAAAAPAEPAAVPTEPKGDRPAAVRTGSQQEHAEATRPVSADSAPAQPPVRPASDLASTGSKPAGSDRPPDWDRMSPPERHLWELSKTAPRKLGDIIGELLRVPGDGDYRAHGLSTLEHPAEIKAFAEHLAADSPQGAMNGIANAVSRDFVKPGTERYWREARADIEARQQRSTVPADRSATPAPQEKPADWDRMGDAERRVWELGKNPARGLGQIIEQLAKKPGGDYRAQGLAELRHPAEIKAFAQHLAADSPEGAMNAIANAVSRDLVKPGTERYWREARESIEATIKQAPPAHGEASKPPSTPEEAARHAVQKTLADAHDLVDRLPAGRKQGDHSTYPMDKVKMQMGPATLEIDGVDVVGGKVYLRSTDGMRYPADPWLGLVEGSLEARAQGPNGDEARAAQEALRKLCGSVESKVSVIQSLARNYADSTGALPSATTAATGFATSSTRADMTAAPVVAEEGPQPVLDRSRSRTGGRNVADATAELASGQGDIRPGQGGGFVVDASGPHGHPGEVARSEELQPADLDEMRRHIIEGDGRPEEKAAALEALKLAENPAHTDARDIVARAAREAGRAEGLKGAEGHVAGVGLVMLTLAGWYTMYKMNNVRDSYVPAATVN